MNALFRIPIRLQLMLVVAIVALPAIGIITFSGVQQRKSAIIEARMNTRRLVDRIGSEQRILVASAQQLVVSLSKLPEIQEKDADKVSNLLSNIFKLHPNFTIIFVADSTGNIWASSVPITKPVTVADRRYFKNALASGQLSSGEFQIGRISQKPTLNLGYPYGNGHGDIVGVVSLGISLADYGILLRQTQLPKRSDITLIDYKGLILYSSVAPERIGTLTNPVLFKKILEGPDTDTLTAAGIAGDPPRQERYVSYQKLRLEGEQSPYMYIRVGIPVDSVLSQAHKQMVKNLSFFTLILVSSLLLAWLVGKRSIADRIILLEKASQSLAGGDLRIRVSELIKGGELGRLGESFDAMAVQLLSREESLSGSQRFLNTIIDTEPECLKLLDAEGRVLMMNPAGLNILDAESFEQVKGQSIYPLITQEYRDAFVQLTNNVFRGVSGNLEFEAVGLKQRHVWLETHAVPFRDDAGEIVSLLGITRDITARMQADQALRQSERDLKKAQEIAKLGSWTYDMSDPISWSEELYRIYGVSPETFIPTVDAFMSLIHPEDRPLMQAWIKASAADEHPGEFEFRVIRPDGTLCYISGRGELIHNEKDGQIRMTGTAQDITERKKAEEALAEKQRLLEELNISLAKRVEDAVSESRKKDQLLISQGRQAAMGEMIGNIAHQWRQPLNTLGLVVQELRMTYGRDEDYKQSLYANVDKAMDLIQHMSKTIDDFSNYFRPDKEKTLFDLNEAVAKALTLVESSLAHLNISIEIIENDKIFLQGYENEYYQVLLNILLNCRDAFEESEIDQGRVITIKVFKENDRSVVTVGDNAGGVPESIIDKIFDPYFTTKGPDKGTGIGLYMAKTIIEKNMGGTLTVCNKEDGAEFRIEV